MYTAKVCAFVMYINKRTSFAPMCQCYVIKTNGKCHSCTLLSYGCTSEVQAKGVSITLSSVCFGVYHRVLISVDVTKNKVLKLWDLLRYSEST